MSGDLFRQEVIDAQSRRLHGDIILQRSWSMRLVTLVILLIMGSGAVWVTLGSYSRVETVQGILMPVAGASKILALHPGVVTAVFVKEGELVRAGQQLAVVRVESPNAAGEVGSAAQLGSNERQTIIAERQIMLSGRRFASELERLDETISGMRLQASSIADQIALQEQVVNSARTNFDQIKSAVDRGYISKLEFERRRQAMLQAQQDLSRLRQQLLANRAEIGRLGKDRERTLVEGETAADDVRSQLESLRQQRSRIAGEASYSLNAPISGRITSLQVTLGSTVGAAVPLMAILADGSGVKADLFLTSRAIGFVRPGQEVRLRYDAFPYQRFGSHIAHVQSVSRLAIAGLETGAPFKIEEPVYRVTTTLPRQTIDAYGKLAPLQPGMTLSASIILERQSFLDWLLNPLRTVANRN